MSDGAWLYILRCADGSYYVGTTRSSLEMRVAQHNLGTFGGYTASRRPVELVFSQWFDQVTDAIENERKLKKWSRAKKEALMHGDFASLPELSMRKTTHPFFSDKKTRFFMPRRRLSGQSNISYGFTWDKVETQLRRSGILTA